MEAKLLLNSCVLSLSKHQKAEAAESFTRRSSTDRKCTEAQNLSKFK